MKSLSLCSEHMHHLQISNPEHSDYNVQRVIPALQVEGGWTVVTAEQVSPFSAAVTGVMVRGTTAPPDVPHQLPAPFLHFLRLRRCQKTLDLLWKYEKLVYLVKYSE